MTSATRAVLKTFQATPQFFFETEFHRTATRNNEAEPGFPLDRVFILLLSSIKFRLCDILLTY